MWPENVKAVQVFQLLGTQWQCAPMGGYLGLNYAVLPTVIQWAGIQIPTEDMPDVFHALRWLENAALKVLNAKED